MCAYISDFYLSVAVMMVSLTRSIGPVHCQAMTPSPAIKLATQFHPVSTVRDEVTSAFNHIPSGILGANYYHRHQNHYFPLNILKVVSTKGPSRQSGSLSDL
jgi:hypothetical protein